MYKTLALFFALASLWLPSALANQPAQPITQQQLEALWQQYVARSQKLRKADQDQMRKEIQRSGQKEAQKPAYTKEFGFDTNQPPEWFASKEGSAIMEAILSLQTPSGGWSKRTDMTKKRRLGVAYGSEKNYIPTFDNNATTMQLTLLAKAYTATGKKAYKAAFERGLELIFAAQFPNGGWPQTFPLVGGYHNLLTYNDELMVNIMFLLRDIASGEGNYAFTSAQQRNKAQQSLAAALECVLSTQVIIDGQPTIWGAQHDPFTLLPAQARAYEMAALTSTESVWMLRFLMSLENPNAELVEAVHSAIDWYKATQINGKTWQRGNTALTDDANAQPLWARFYELGTNRPIFGDRDGSIHYSLSGISKERLEGYTWYSTSPNHLLRNYPKWAAKHPRAQ